MTTATCNVDIPAPAAAPIYVPAAPKPPKPLTPDEELECLQLTGHICLREGITRRDCVDMIYAVVLRLLMRQAGG